ncbi:MAG: glycosyltransferase [Acidobacteriia bacterium]|nr:glycosyltransferase [Terriglobia bacterium]
MTRPFVSVLVDTYNHEGFIEQALHSVLEQDFPAADREILVVDDGSTDRTPEILRRFAPQVRVLRKANGGQASAFNAGIPECRGEIIAFLDGDDWWAPAKLRRVAEFLAAEPAAGFVGHGILESFGDGTLRAIAPEKPERLRLNSLAAARVFRLRKSYLGTSRMIMRAAIARQILPVPEALVIEADEYLFTLAAALGDLVILPDTLTHYRLHGANLYNAGGGNAAGLRRKQRVLAALAETLRRELPARGVPADAVRCVVEIVQAEADQLRLMLDGGAPWETLRTENTIYQVLHGDAPRSHRLFRWATMLPACVLPPRWFYAARRWLAGQSWYRTARAEVLPMPAITRVAGPEEFKG